MSTLSASTLNKIKRMSKGAHHDKTRQNDHKNLGSPG
jgi:hypothetical protein